jgi:hypothetical protein
VLEDVQAANMLIIILVLLAMFLFEVIKHAWQMIFIVVDVFANGISLVLVEFTRAGEAAAFSNI